MKYPAYSLHVAALWLCIVAGSLTTPLLAQPTRAASPPLGLRDLPKDRPYELRVLYLEDRRLPALGPDQRTTLYAKIERLLTTWYGYKVSVRETGHRGLAEHFATQEELFTLHRSRIREADITFTNAKATDRLRDAIRHDFAPRTLEQIERYLKASPLTSKSQAIAIAQQQFLIKLRELRQCPLADGTPFFDPTQARVNSFPYWAVLIQHITEADFVLTNSMIVGADSDMPIYVIARGGLTTGLTDNNDHNPYQAATMAGLFPFLSPAPIFSRERGSIPADELLDVIATFCMHELGHFFLRYAEHYDHPGCVHVAPTGLNYYAWHKAIRSRGPCPLSHRKLTRY